MTSDWTSTGRIRQKRRTRAALVAAARELLGTGGIPTVAEVAEHAEVSQATAYRYFPTLDSLLAEAALATHVAPIEQAIAVAREQPDPEEGLVLVVRAIHRECARSELPWRRLLSRSLDRDPTTGLAEEQERGVGRQGRRLEWLAQALEPARPLIPTETFERLVHALTVVSGIEALVALRDVCKLSVDQAGDMQEWAARALLRGALDRPDA